jgi:hypothetical protein
MIQPIFCSPGITSRAIATAFGGAFEGRVHHPTQVVEREAALAPAVGVDPVARDVLEPVEFRTDHPRVRVEDAGAGPLLVERSVPQRIEPQPACGVARDVERAQAIGDQRDRADRGARQARRAVARLADARHDVGDVAERCCAVGQQAFTDARPQADRNELPAVFRLPRVDGYHRGSKDEK